MTGSAWRTRKLDRRSPRLARENCKNIVTKELILLIPDRIPFPETRRIRYVFFYLEFPDYFFCFTKTIFKISCIAFPTPSTQRRSLEPNQRDSGNHPFEAEKKEVPRLIVGAFKESENNSLTISFKRIRVQNIQVNSLIHFTIIVNYFFVF
jgi:hypothetical protein